MKALLAAAKDIIFEDATIEDLDFMLDEFGPFTLGKKHNGLYRGQIELTNNVDDFDRFVARFGIPEPFPDD